MNYALEIRKHNQQAHIDIEKDIEIKKNGLFTFTIRVNNGNIVDYQTLEYEDSRSYLVFTKIIIEEFTISRSGGDGSEEDSIR